MAICYGDTVDRRDMPVGRFGRKFLYPEAGKIVEEIATEQKRLGDNWPPLKAGICGGSSKRFSELKQQLDKKIESAR